MICQEKGPIMKRWCLWKVAWNLSKLFWMKCLVKLCFCKWMTF